MEIKLASTLPDNKNYKIIADNFISSIPLIVKVKKNMGFIMLETVYGPHLPSCYLPDEKDLKRKGEGAMILV